MLWTISTLTMMYTSLVCIRLADVISDSSPLLTPPTWAWSSQVKWWSPSYLFWCPMDLLSGSWACLQEWRLRECCWWGSQHCIVKVWLCVYIYITHNDAYFVIALQSSYYLDNSSVVDLFNRVKAIEKVSTQEFPSGYGDDRLGGNTVKLLESTVARFGPIASFRGTFWSNRWTVRFSQMHQPYLPGKNADKRVFWVNCS